MPVRPPNRKVTRKPTDQSSGVSNESDPRHSVPIQLKNFTPVGTEVSSVFQTKIGIRNIVMPGMRMVMIVVMKFTEPRIVPKPDSARPMIHRSPPTPGEWIALDSGE